MFDGDITDQLKTLYRWSPSWMSLESQLTRYSIYMYIIYYIYIIYSTLQKGSDDGNTFKHLSCAWETPMTFFFSLLVGPSFPSWPMDTYSSGHTSGAQPKSPQHRKWNESFHERSLSAKEYDLRVCWIFSWRYPSFICGHMTYGLITAQSSHGLRFR